VADRSPPPETERSRLDNRIRRLRRVRGWTQEDFAALLGVTRQTINAIENGRHDPTLALAFDIARAFAARIEDVFRPARHGVETPAWGETMLTVPVRLSADPVVLRRHRAADLPAFQRFVTDPESTRHMAFTEAQKTPEGAAALMDAVIESYAGDAPIFSLTIADPDSDAYLGAAGGAEAGDGAAEVFVTLLPEARGRGRAAAAMRAVADHLIGACGFRELRADVVAENAASVALFERLGYRRAGPVERPAEKGELGHRQATGLRYVLTDRAWRKARP
jgi:DNA-binding XRE family transcriptional regulator/L-amino acid N-acyltransferase YncA